LQGNFSGNNNRSKNGMHHYRVKPNMSMTEISLLSRSIQAQANEKQKINLMDKFRYEGIKLA
jgi:hypothetical protein